MAGPRDERSSSSHIHLYFCVLKNCPLCAALRSLESVDANASGDAKREEIDQQIQSDAAMLNELQVKGMVN